MPPLSNLKSNLNGDDLQSFGSGELCLPRVGGEETTTFQSQRAGDMQQINGPRAQPFGTSGGKEESASDGGIHIQRHFQQRASRYESLQPLAGCRIQRGQPLS